MNHLLIEQQATDRMVRLQDQADSFRAGRVHGVSAAKRVAKALRGLATLLDREHVVVPATELPRPRRLNHQQA